MDPKTKKKVFEVLTYEGEYKNDLKNGKGIFTWSSGSKYIGEFKDDERDGEGKMVWSDGTMYEGEWK